jgi:hypothetical protein
MSRLLIFFAAFTIANTSLGDPVVYPAKGQSPEQQKQDEAECYSWAVDRSGYDPVKPPSSQPATAQSSQPNKPTGARVRGALRGAAIGEIADGDTGDAAAAGAIAGGSRDRRERRRTNQQAQSAATQPQQAGQEALNKARAACLEGRGYTVK